MKCKNCQTIFQIDETDKNYYQNIDVPEPTWCPTCREIRRMSWANEMYLYQNQCKLCNKKVVSHINHTNPRLIYCIDCWWSDKWNPLDFGQDIDWNRSFFEQLHELELKTPHCSVLIDTGTINSEYTHLAGQQKNCYLIFHATYAEDCYYSYGVKKAKNCIDVHYCHSSNFCYECTDVKDCYNLAWCQDCNNCGTSSFLYDCHNCVDCFMCFGLRNKKYCFLNHQLSKEEYEQKLSEINTGSSTQIDQFKKQFQQQKLKHPQRFMQTKMIENSLGDHLYNAKNSFYCFDSSDIEDSRYCSQMQLGAKDCYDIYQYGVKAELCYEGAMIGTNAYNIKFCSTTLWQVSNLSYCIESYSSHDCFGCFGLNHNSFCILNKKYSEQEYKQLTEKLIQKMKTDNEFGEFLPIKYSQAAYNESTAQLWYPLSKKEALDKGYNWQDNLPGTYGKETIKNLPDTIQEVSSTITTEILICESCCKNYKIIEQELKFYKQHNYPLPRTCFECRRISRMKKRNPRKCWLRNCMNINCNNEFYSSYSPSRTETIYCETCYQNSSI